MFQVLAYEKLHNVPGEADLERKATNKPAKIGIGFFCV
jgi:hypothetical protein